MPHNCCVPKCHSNSKKNKDLRFHRFPKKKLLKEQWIDRIRRDEGPKFVVNDNTRVCSKHFIDQDYTVSELGKGCKTVLKKGALPSVFCWTKSQKSRKTKTSTEGLKGYESPHKKKRPSCVQCDEKQTIIDDLQEQIKSKDSMLSQLRNNIATLEMKIDDLESEKKDIESQVKEKARHCCFGVDNFKNDDRGIRYYTGMSNWDVFIHLFDFLKERIPKMNYWRSGKPDERFVEHDIRQGRPRSLTKLDEFFLTLVRLRQGFPTGHLAFLFKVSNTTVSRVFLTWINLLYLELGAIPIWQSKHLVDETMPKEFKEKYQNTRCIIDCTEIKINKPSSLAAQSQCFSSYKNTTTAKGLLGIAPSGAPTFISELYNGSISDKDITKQCGVLELFEKGDGCMADKGFNIKELLDPLDVSLNIPPFLSEKGHFDESEVESTQSIASVRIHVERAISRIKIYKIINNVVPLTIAGVLNQIWTVCCMLLLFQPPIINQEDEDDDE